MSDTLSTFLKTVADHTATLGPRVTMVGELAGSDAHARKLLGELRASPGGRGLMEEGELLGEGGMGSVNQATQHAVGRDVAIKRVKSSVRSARNTLRLLQEGWVTGMLEHPNIVPVHDIGVDSDGIPFLVLKRIGGDSWVDYIYDESLLEQRFDPPDLIEWHLRVLLDVCDGIAFAHSRGIIHRDIKPDNVMVGSFGEVLVMDWGLALTVDENADPRLPKRSPDEGPVGTPAYMAPEMVPHEGSAPLSPRTDVYQLGACLYEVICGEPPHDAYNPTQLLRQILHGSPSFPAGSPAGLVRICQRAMAVRPEDRQADVPAFAADLRSYLRHRSSEQAARLAHQRASALSELLIDDPDKVETIHELFGAVRFGYRHALQSWDGNREAKRGLAEAAEALARWELARGAPRAAQRCLAEVEGVDKGLVEQVQHAVAEAIDKEQAATAWELAHDRSLGLGARRVAMLLVGIAVSVTPLSYRYVEVVTFGEAHHALAISASVGLLAFALAAVGIMRWWGGPLSPVSRTVAQAVIIVPIGQILVTVGGFVMGLDPRPTEVLFLLLWATIASVLALQVDRRLWMGAAGYAVGFVVAAAWPDRLFEVLAGANAVQTISALWTWGRR